MLIRMCGLLWMLVAPWAMSGDGYGEPSPQIPPGQRGLDALKGEWACEVTIGDQTFQGKFVNSWIIDGFVFKQEWSDPYAKGLELRAFNPKDGTWSGYDIYTGDTWTSTAVTFEEGKLIVSHGPKNSEKGVFISKEIYWDITANSFKISSKHSYDQGKTWVDGSFEIKAMRVK